MRLYMQDNLAIQMLHGLVNEGQMRFVCVAEALLDLVCYQYHVISLKEIKAPTVLI